MTQNTFIRKFIAASLLAVFALSITPTKVLHYFFANHKDSVIIKTKDSKCPSLSVAGFNCQVDNLVVESPFTVLLQPVSCTAPEVITIIKIYTAASFICADHFYFELRGPPSLA
ncbi:MAG: hypothetical protein M3015_04820 [Bacteroidota bacterium]|nr:hypothetical protein [Bacteroidota bacterium]